MSVLPNGRTGFTCFMCKASCDASYLGEMSTGALSVCRVCEESFCATCDDLYSVPVFTPPAGYETHCRSCGRFAFVKQEVAQNITALNEEAEVG